MLIVLRVILSVIVVLIAGYGIIITKNIEFLPYMMFFLSLMMLVMGLDEFQKGRKVSGWISIAAFLFVLFVSIQCFLLTGGNT